MIVALAEMGKTLLISSHILSELAEVCHRVGIIEHGQLLAVGTVDEILQGQATRADEDAPDQHKNTVVITVADDIQQCVQFLASSHSIEPIEVSENSVTIPISDQLNEQADLLAELVRAGVRVSSFQPKQRSLEEAFLHVTQGRVQ